MHDSSPALSATCALPWHALDAAEAAALLAVDPGHGLSQVEARARLERVGPNTVGEHRERSIVRLVLDQFASLVVLLLLAAAAVAWGLGEGLEAVAILAALVLNAAIGAGSEWRARRSLAGLRALAVPRAVAWRDGRPLSVLTAELVPGDLIVLEAGAHVPADARLVSATALRMSEAALTGESFPVDKDATALLSPDAPLSERSTMVYLGTGVLAGAGRALVTATGLATELGRIGQMVALAGERATPLEMQVDALGRRLVVLAVGICAVVGVVGILHGEPIGLMLETAISLAIAAIPEGLPAITTVALAAGLWRLARAGALVRRLPAVETLGSTTVICADKTGTMTENQMTVRRLVFGGRSLDVSGGGRSTAGAITEHGAPVDVQSDRLVRLLLTAGALVNDATATLADGGLALGGDPTEAALLVAALKAGLDPAALREIWPRRREIPFDPGRRLMTTFHEATEGRRVLFVKGGPGAVLDLCAHRESAAGPLPMTDDDRARIRGENDLLAADALRVLAVAWNPDGWPAEGLPSDLVFLGLVGLADPLRAGVEEAIGRCARAGIRTMMLTGDQRATAEAVGSRLGLPPDAIRSRVTPEGKMKLVEELQGRGEVVAMTGDGVNDAPALARADIGVAMGRAGTDVAREAAHLVLTDDNFATIVRAVEQGRVIYANLRKTIHFLFSCNLSEILTIFVAILLGYPTPLLPLQILWINLVTDILPALALVRDPAEPDVMTRPPRNPAEALVTWGFGLRIVLEGAVLAAGVLSAYIWAAWQDGPGARASTMAFVAIVLVHPLQAMYCRSERTNWWRLPLNPLSWMALVVLVVLQWAAIGYGPMNRLLSTAPLALGDWGVVAMAVLWPVVLVEAAKTWGWRVSLGHARPTRSGLEPGGRDETGRNP
jgi:P-type Ca2+ transporter type 2C